MTGASQPSPAAYLRLVALGVAVGIPAALVAALFLALVRDLQHRLWGDGSPAWYLVLGLPVAGAVVVLAARRLLPGDGGHSPLHGIGAGVTPPAHAPGIALAALGTLAFGAVLGPEAPLIALGAAVALLVTRFARLESQARGVIAAAGSFAAISALFGGPIVGAMLMLEAGVGLGAALIPALLPGFVAAAVGYVIFIGFGNWGGLDAPGLVVPDLPAYHGTHLLDLLLAPAIGLAAALLIGAARVIAKRFADGERRVGLPVLLLGGGLAVGGVAELAQLLGADSQDVLFSGQASVPAVIAEQSAWIVLLLLAAKGLAYAICLGCGFRGGAVFPAIFLGVGLATLAVIALDVSPAYAVAVGAAAGTAAGTGLLITPVLLATLLVGTADVDTVPAAVLAAAAAWLVRTALERRGAAATGSPSPG